jgi:hypothetical protein
MQIDRKREKRAVINKTANRRDKFDRDLLMEGKALEGHICAVRRFQACASV